MVLYENMAQPTDFALIQLFHSMPVEIKEKIQRFTYKKQNKSLLEDIRGLYDAVEYIRVFTEIIDTANATYGMRETTEVIYACLWPGLVQIRNNYIKYKFMPKWKYFTDFTCTAEAHKNGVRTFQVIPWEQSFALYFWLCIVIKWRL